MIESVFCNICLIKMEVKPGASKNYCSAQCLKYSKGETPKGAMQHFGKFMFTAKLPPALQMSLQSECPVPRIAKQSYHPSRLLRIRGLGRKHLTTKIRRE